VQDLGHICEASGVGAEIALESVPLDPSLVAAYPEDARTIAATAGEDYELLLVAPDDVLANVSAALDAPVIIVGSIVAGEPRVRVVDAAGKDVALARGGFDHLRPK
jgi:thiamine-monophosphate kinase